MDDDAFGSSDRVALLWPQKTEATRAFQDESGRWTVSTDSPPKSLRGLTTFSYFPEGQLDSRSLLITGQRHDALAILRHAIGPEFRFIYVDLPRLDVDDSASAFQTVSPLRLTTWLSTMRLLLLSARELLSRTGVIAIHCGEAEAHYSKLIIEELFRGKRVGTIIWQKTYSARNMPGMKEFTDTHDLIYLYARDKDALPAVGLRRPPEGYANSDGDPRGAWKAEHKGAKTRRENSDFDTYQPPYRWRVIDGALPPGLWRLSPFTGVIWGRPTVVGNYEFAVEVSDNAGSTSRKKLSIEVRDSGMAAEASPIPWIFDEIVTDGPLQVETSSLPPAVINEPYSTIVIGKGGEPYRGPPIRPGSGRYWDFAKATLLIAYQQDSVNLGSRQPTSIPTPKKYEPPSGALEIENQQSIWMGRTRDASSKVPETFAGFTEDATKHLKALKELGLVENEIPTAKPEKLLMRLLDVFTDKGDLVLELMSSSADLAAVALKSDRRFISLQGSAPHDLAITASCALPRLKAVVQGDDQNLEERAPNIKLSKGAYIPFTGGGSFATAEVGIELALLPMGEDRPILVEAVSSMSNHELSTSILTAEGYMPSPSGEFALAIDGHGRALIIPPTQYLTPELASEIGSMVDGKTDGHPTTIFYFKATEDMDEKLFEGRISLRRVPFDLLRPDIA